MSVNQGFTLSAILSQPNQTVSSATLTLSVSPFTVYNLTVSDVQPLTSTSVHFNPVTITTTGSYLLNMVDPFGNNVSAASTLTVYSLSITSFATTPSPLNTSIAFTSSCVLNNSATLTNAYLKNTTSSALTAINTSPALPQTASSFNFTNVPSGKIYF